MGVTSRHVYVTLRIYGLRCAPPSVSQVHQKVKVIATRERSLHGGSVFVVRDEVIESLGVEASKVPLKPSPAALAALAASAAATASAAAAAAAAATAAAAASVFPMGDDGGGDGGVTSPGSGDKVIVGVGLS